MFLNITLIHKKSNINLLSKDLYLIFILLVNGFV